MKNNLKIFILIIMICILSSCKKTAISVDSIQKETKKIQETNNKTKQIVQEKIKIIDTDYKTGYDIVKYGKFDLSIGYQGDIEWLVVDKNKDSYLLVSKDILYCKNFNEEKEEIIFENSTLNDWLNENFLNEAFSSKEISNMKNVSEFNIRGNKKVSLLNLLSCKKYFGANENANENYQLSALGTAFAVSNWLEVDKNKTSRYYNCGSYFLTDNGDTMDKAMWVGQKGKIYSKGQSVTLNHGDGIRPVIVLSSELFDNVEIKKLSSVNEIVIETTTIEEDIVEDDFENIFEEETIFDNEQENDSENNIEDTLPAKLYEYSNTIDEKYKSDYVPTSETNVVDLQQWDYGRTPIEWIFVEPNTQIICNNSPNRSINYSYKKSASSGSKGCFIPIFINSNSVGEDFDGRLYSFYDYTKKEPTEMSWSTKFNSIKYNGYNVKELLSKKYNIEDVSQYIVKVNDTLVNIIYASELEEIIEEYIDN